MEEFDKNKMSFLENENYRLKERNKRLMRILGIKWCINNKKLILKK
jgi:hypothetical protein|tara:strand:- start:214 stop:351 length:138 start_codon:yes stop_codon:yes gene_type:complete